MAENEDWLSVGKIVGVHGLQGELRVNPASDFPERFTAPGPRWLRPPSPIVPEGQAVAGGARRAGCLSCLCSCCPALYSMVKPVASISTAVRSLCASSSLDV